MFNKSTGAWFMALYAFVSMSWAQLAPAPTSVLTSVPAQTPANASASTPGAALVYKNPASPLTVAELAAVQRKRLEQEFYKKAGLTTQIKSVPVKPVATKKAVAKAPATVQRFTLMAVYGTQQSVRAEIQTEGRVRVVQPQAQLGWATVESIAPGRVQLRVAHTGQSSVHSLVPGETLEVTR
jgi:hypothetical protein